MYDERFNACTRKAQSANDTCALAEFTFTLWDCVVMAADHIPEGEEREGFQSIVRDGKEAMCESRQSGLDFADSISRAMAISMAKCRFAWLSKSGFAPDMQVRLLNMPFDSTQLFGIKADESLEKLQTSKAAGKIEVATVYRTIEGCTRVDKTRSFRTQNYQALQAMIFAVEEINRSLQLLPNITLGFQIYDSCRMMQRSLEGTLWMLAGQKNPAPNFRCQKNLPLLGIIGDAGSSCSIVMARILGLFRLPQTVNPATILTEAITDTNDVHDCVTFGGPDNDIPKSRDCALDDGEEFFVDGSATIDQETGAVLDRPSFFNGPCAWQPRLAVAERLQREGLVKSDWNAVIRRSAADGLANIERMKMMDFSAIEKVESGCNGRYVDEEREDCDELTMTPKFHLKQSKESNLISYVSSSPLLSDRIQFPSFFRTIPNDNFQSKGLAYLLMHLGWTWVGLLIEDNDYGQQGASALKQELANAGACIAFSENIILSRKDRNAKHIIQVIKNSTTNAIVIFSSDAGLTPLMDEMMRHNLTGRVWIASEGWSTSTVLAVDKYSQILAGAIGFATYSGEIPGFENHLNSVHPSSSTDNVFVKRFWEEAFGCKWPDEKNVTLLWDNTSKLCTGNEKLDSLHIDYNDVSQLRGQYNAYTAVYASAWTLHNLNTCKKELQSSISGLKLQLAESVNFNKTVDQQLTQLIHYLKNVRFRKNGGGEVFFNQNGEVPAQYDIINFQQNAEGSLKHVIVGKYDSSAPEGQTLIFNASKVLWASGITQIPASVCTQSCLPGSRKAVREGEPVCCYLCIPCPLGEISNQTDAADCFKCQWDRWPNAQQDKCIPKTTEYLSYEETLAIILAVICILCSLMPAAILVLFINHSNTPIVKANNRSLSYFLLMSLTLCFLCSFAFIGYPTREKCLIQQVAFGITFTQCISCILAKTIMVVIAFNATKPNSDLRRWVGPQLSYMVTSVGTLIQILLCVSWLSVSPPFSQYNILSQPGMIILECNEGSPIAFWCMLGYLGLLSAISFIVAFLARKLPDSFNEAKFITFSMLAFLSVWISFIPAYLSTKGKYMVAMEIFAILTSSSALVFCIFIPKCYIILLRPEMNTREYLMGRETGQSNKNKHS
ncbi:vomeronasal type-2 receptor 1-like [Ambystoma mexicanum]|uniref:vomeronasal type-2 receptor 1-like n=1 Tax=Ambystoma mexicanum TaxID=8296 RepID=UPI0037E82FCA